MKQETYRAEPSDTDVSDANSIAGVTARLVRWGRIAPAGLARVEYVSARAQEAVLERLRSEFQAQNIPFHEIELTPYIPAEQHILRLRETLSKLPPGVVSITGLNRAFPADVLLLESLGILNLYRDTLVHFNLRQIWWMQGSMANTFRLYDPDFDRFFLVRLHLTEIPPTSEMHSIQNTLPEGDLLTYQEAKQTASYYTNRFYKALRERRPLSELMSLCVNVFKPLVQAGHILEASERQEQLFAEMERAGYDLKSYQEGEIDLTQMELRDADNFNELGTLRWQQGRFSDAQVLEERDFEIKHHLLPPNHPDIARILSNLAMLCELQGRYKEAESLYKEALALLQQALPENHPNIAISLDNLAVLYGTQGRYSEAESLHLKALAILHQALPERNPNIIAQSLNNLAELYRVQGRYSEAEPLYKEGLAISEQAFGPDHPVAKTIRGNLERLHQERQPNQR